MGTLDDFEENDVQLVNTLLVAISMKDTAQFVASNPRLRVYMQMRIEFCRQQGLELNEQLMAGDLIFGWLLGYQDFQRQQALVMSGKLSSDSRNVPEMGNAVVPMYQWVKNDKTWDSVLHDLMGGDDDDDVS